MKSYKRRAISGALVAVLLLAVLSMPARLSGTGARASVVSAPAPDLTIESVSLSPDIASIGDTLTFTVKIKNRGDLQAGDSQLACLIDERLLTSTSINPIDPGKVMVKTITWKAQAGPHVFRALIDGDDSVDESVENNNDKTYAFSVLAPDLAIDAITWSPAHPATGDKVTFTITVINQGDKRAASSQIDFSIDGNSRGYQNISQIEAGDSVNATYVWTAEPGVHNVKAVADVFFHVTESDEANNTSEATCATILPDLIITSITVSPQDFLENTSVIFYVTVKNQGGSRTGPCGVSFYLDNSQQDWNFLGSLEPDAAVTANFTWSVVNGPQVFKAIADAENIVQENDEANNTRTFSLGPLYPDLVIQDITWSPSIPMLNLPVSFNVTVKNLGKVTSAFSELKFSIDGAYTFSNLVEGLSANATATVTFSWMPRSLSHTVKATIDEANLIKESNESNNTMTKTVTVTRPVPTADLIVEQITLSPAKPAIASTVTATVRVKNQGTGTAGPSVTAIYIDSKPVDSVYTKELGAGQAVSLDIIIPLQGLPFKDAYRISAVADSNNTVFETNESNNQKDASFSQAAPDLVVQSITWSPEAPAAGNMVTFNIIVKNQGDLKSGSTYISYYMDRVFMGKHSVEEMEPGTTTTRSLTYTTPTGSFLFTVIVDEASEISEKDESNNSRTVSIPAPDLLIESITWLPQNPTEITPVSFTASVRNRGYGWSTRTQLFCYFDGVKQISLEAGEMDPESTTSISFTYSFLPGEHSIRLVADGNDAAPESNESNNEKTVKFSVQPRITSVPPSSANSSAKTEVKTPVPTSTATSNTTKATVLPTKTTTPVKDVAANITAPPSKWQGILQNQWIIMGTAAAGLAAIGLLLIFRKKARRKQPAEE